MSKRKPSSTTFAVAMTKTVVKAKPRKLKATWRLNFADFSDTSNDDLIKDLTEKPKSVDSESDWS